MKSTLLLQSDPVELDYIKELKTRFMKPHKKAGLVKIVSSDEIPKSISEWKTPDFMRYYQKLYKEKYKVEFKFNKLAWKQFGGVIKRFIQRHNLTPMQYKDFLDKLFATICTGQFIPVPGFMTSDKLYQRYLTLAVTDKSFPKPDLNRFKEAKTKLKSSRSIFSEETRETSS